MLPYSGFDPLFCFLVFSFPFPVVCVCVFSLLFLSGFLIWVWIILRFGVLGSVGGVEVVFCVMGVVLWEFWLRSGGSV